MNGFIAMPVLHSTKFVGISCRTAWPSGPRVVYSTWSACTAATRADVINPMSSCRNLFCAPSTGNQ